MTKKEQAYIEELKTLCAFRLTDDIEPDVKPPTSESKFGTLSTGFTACFDRVELACSSSCGNGIGRQDKTDSQGVRSLYSTRLLALKALRREVEKRCMRDLRRVDRMIEQEQEPKL